MPKAPGMIRKRGSGWQVVIRIEGERHQFGPRAELFLGSDPSRNEVEEWTWRKYRELEKASRRSAVGLPGVVHFSQLLKQFREEELPTLAPGTQKSYEDSLGPIETYLVEERGDPTLDRIHTRDVKAYLSWRRVRRRDGAEGTVSNRTLAKDRAVLHRLFSFADDLEYREGSPVARVRAPDSDGRDPVLLTPEQYERLIAECADRPMLRLWALVLGETGARAYSEALHLQWQDVDLEEGSSGSHPAGTATGRRVERVGGYP